MLEKTFSSKQGQGWRVSAVNLYPIFPCVPLPRPGLHDPWSI